MGDKAKGSWDPLSPPLSNATSFTCCWLLFASLVDGFYDFVIQTSVPLRMFPESHYMSFCDPRQCHDLLWEVFHGHAHTCRWLEHCTLDFLDIYVFIGAQSSYLLYIYSPMNQLGYVLECTFLVLTPEALWIRRGPQKSIFSTTAPGDSMNSQEW